MLIENGKVKLLNTTRDVYVIAKVQPDLIDEKNYELGQSILKNPAFQDLKCLTFKFKGKFNFEEEDWRTKIPGGYGYVYLVVHRSSKSLEIYCQSTGEKFITI